jgi:hypothetical protein
LEGRRDALRQMWAGVAIAVVLCATVGVALDVLGEELPQQKQEGLETIVGLVAVAMITYMIVWMTRHSRGIKAELEGEAASALATGSAIALVGMAFLAVLREGFETSVFLLAAFQDARNTTAAGAGAVLGVICALLIGLALYRGGAHQPEPVLPDHRPRPRLRRRRPARHRRAHGPRRGLALELPMALYVLVPRRGRRRGEPSGPPRARSDEAPPPPHRARRRPRPVRRRLRLRRKSLGHRDEDDELQDHRRRGIDALAERLSQVPAVIIGAENAGG